MMKLSKSGQALIKGFEGLRLHAYQDSAGVWTIGYGSTRYTNGESVKKGDLLANEEAASALFLKTLAAYETAVNQSVMVALTQNQYDALVSLAYNEGTGVMRGTTIVKKLNLKDYAAAAEQFLVWNKITDVKTKKKIVCETLVKRREKEREYFLAYDTESIHQHRG